MYLLTLRFRCITVTGDSRGCSVCRSVPEQEHMSSSPPRGEELAPSILIRRYCTLVDLTGFSRYGRYEYFP